MMITNDGRVFMFKIALCDDNVTDLSKLTTIIDAYNCLQTNHNHIIEYKTFYNPIDLIEEVSRSNQYDFIILDIVMPMMTGISVAKEIRTFNKEIRLVFFSSSSDFAIDSYSTDAYHYGLKPVSKESVFLLLDRLIYEINDAKNKNLIVNNGSEIIRIAIHRLEFAEVIGRSILYHLNDGSVIESTGSISELEKKLSLTPCFIKPHRSYIINMNYIDTIKDNQIKMDSLNIVPMSKKNYSTIKSTYMAFAFNDLKKHNTT